MKSSISVLICLIVAVCLLGCNNPEAKCGEGEVYGLTNSNPVYVSMKVDGDGKIGEVKLEEYLSVYDIGALEQKNGKLQKYGVEIRETENGFAKYVRVGKKKFVYEANGYYCEFAPEKSYEKYMEEGGAKWYIECVSDGNFDIVNDKGENYDVSFDEYDDYKLDKKLWANKMKNGYHEGEEYENGWKEDIYNLITHLKNHGFYDYTGEEKPQGKKKTFKVGKYDTLVTLENFHDYMRISKKAYEQARNNIK